MKNTTNSNDYIKLAEDDSFAESIDRVLYSQTDEKDVLNAALDKLLGQAHFAKTIDVGAGPGLLSNVLYQRSDHLTLLELMEAYKLPLQRKFPKANVVIDSVFNYSFDSDYDIILLSHVIYYLNLLQWKPFLEKLFSCLHKDGKLILIISDIGKIFNLFPALSSPQEEVYVPEIAEFTSHFPNNSVVDELIFPTKIWMKDDAAINNYLTHFFRLSDSAALKQCAAEVVEFKTWLKQDSKKQYLPVNNHIFVLSPA